jgi:hypothetical protein
MKRLTIALLLSTVSPTNAASPSCRLATVSRVHRIATTSHAANHNVAHEKLIVTAFAVPVAVPVAPFAPYWYGIADYHHSSFPRSAWERPAREAPPRASNRDAAHTTPFEDSERATTREHSILSQKCTTCHGRTSPKMGLSLADPSTLSAEDRLRALRAIIEGAMPPAGEPPLTPDERDAILRELTE